jgi:hypothetical protein
MMLAGPLALTGRAALHEIELRRERVNRCQCSSGLKQLRLALDNYSGTYQVGLSDTLPDVEPGNSNAVAEPIENR